MCVWNPSVFYLHGHGFRGILVKESNTGGMDMKALGHFKTITHHKLLVMHYCFRVGLIRQGLMHDLSKYSWTEFRIGAKYYTGTHSPNASERNELGYSTAWLHHKGRNKHHLEYWMDYGGKNMQMVGQPMPTRYMVELCLDRIAACRVYHGIDYTDKDPLDYLNRSRDSNLMHPITRQQIVVLLTMLAEKGEKETLRYIRNVVLKNPVKLYRNVPALPVDPQKKDGTFLSDQSLKELLQTLPTPFYLYSQAEIEKNCKMLRQAFSLNPGFRQFFPVKATPTAAILKLLRESGCRRGLFLSGRADALLQMRIYAGRDFVYGELSHRRRSCRSSKFGMPYDSGRSRPGGSAGGYGAVTQYSWASNQSWRCFSLWKR